MDIQPHEIAEINEIGTLDGNSVKLARTKGGLNIAIGRKKGKTADEVLLAGSHPAIVKFNLEKQFSTFQPVLQKSEISINPALVIKHTERLTEDLQKSGHDLYSIQSGSNIEFQLTKHDIKVGSIKTELIKDSLVITESKLPKEFSGAIAAATMDKAVACGVSKVKFQG